MLKTENKTDEKILNSFSDLHCLLKETPKEVIDKVRKENKKKVVKQVSFFALIILKIGAWIS